MGLFSRKKDTALVKQTGAARADGWFSALGGFGVSGKDKRLTGEMDPTLLSNAEVQNLWRGSDIAGRIIELMANECYRQGWDVTLEDKEQSEEAARYMTALGATKASHAAKEFERAYGGGAIYPVINDGSSSLAEPLNEDRIATISHLIVFEAAELQPAQYYSSPLEPKFREPETYRVTPYTRGGLAATQFEIHESRIIPFDGIRVSTNQATQTGWGDGVLNRVFDVLRDYGIAWSAAGVLLSDFSQASFKIKGLAQLMAEDKDDVIKTRIRAIELSRSSVNMVLLDAGEEYERKQTPVAGMPELLDRFATRIAAAARTPVTLLMGQSPAGLNATGDSDVRFWYDSVASEQELKCRPQLERLLELVLLANDGPTRGKLPDSYAVTFRPLWQPTDAEVATTRKTVADTDAVYIDRGVVSPEEVAIARYGGDEYSMELQINIEEREALEAAAGTDLERAEEEAAGAELEAKAAVEPDTEEE